MNISELKIKRREKILAGIEQREQLRIKKSEQKRKNILRKMKLITREGLQPAVIFL